MDTQKLTIKLRQLKNFIQKKVLFDEYKNSDLNKLNLSNYLNNADVINFVVVKRFLVQSYRLS